MTGILAIGIKMTDATLSTKEPRNQSKKTIIASGLGALVLGATAFFITYSGLLPNSAEKANGHVEVSGLLEQGSEQEVAFVALDPLVISLGKFASARHLRFRAHLEVELGIVDGVEHMMPRIMDVLNTYLRAVSESELEDPTAMGRLRAQMFRRVQVVIGREGVRDLLITEFILN